MESLCYRLVLQLLLGLFVIPTIIVEKINVSWKLITPAEFGKSVHLQCSIRGTSECSSLTKRWIGGPNYETLCLDNRCTPNTKYKIAPGDACTYILEITKFWENDGNCDYICGYGATNNRKRLNITEKSFQYVPAIKDVKRNTAVTLSNGTISVSVFMKMVYPLPQCFISIDNAIHDLEAKTNSTGTDIFYNNITLSGVFGLTKCSAEIRAVCEVGNRNMILYLKVTKCEKGINRTYMYYIMVSCVILFIISGAALLSVYMYKRIQVRTSVLENRYTHYEINDIDLELPHLVEEKSKVVIRESLLLSNANTEMV